MIDKPKTFTFPFAFHEHVEEVVATAHLFASKPEAAAKGWEFTGDKTKGHIISPSMEVKYAIDNDQIEITIIKKPILLPWMLIEMKLREYMGADISVITNLLDDIKKKNVFVN